MVGEEGSIAKAKTVPPGSFPFGKTLVLITFDSVGVSVTCTKVAVFVGESEGVAVCCDGIVEIVEALVLVAQDMEVMINNETKGNKNLFRLVVTLHCIFI